MKVSNDPALWRFASLQQTLEANTDLIAWSIYACKEQSMTVAYKAETFVAVPIYRQSPSVKSKSGHLDTFPSND